MISLVYPEKVSSKIQHPFITLINVKQDTFLTSTNHLWKAHNSLHSVREEHFLPFQEGSKDSCLLPLYFNSALEVLANALKQENICTHIYTHTYIYHTHTQYAIHIYTQAYTHICQCTYTYTQIHAQIHPYTDTNTQTYIYTNTHKHTHTYTNKYTQTHT